MSTLYKEILKATSTQDVRHGGTVSERIDGPRRSGRYVEVLLQPRLSLGQLQQHIAPVGVGLVRHYPTTGNELQLTFLHQPESIPGYTSINRYTYIISINLCLRFHLLFLILSQIFIETREI